MNKRASGILMHISSLPGEYGIGDFGKNAYKFVDFLNRSKQSYWQILPLSITTFGDSPYQSVSAFAGNPYFIDLDEFLKDEYLSQEDIVKTDFGNDPNYVDFGKLYKNKMWLLRKAYSNSRDSIMDSLIDFYNEEKDWLRDFALYMALKNENKGKPWHKWPREYKFYNSSKVMEFEKENQNEVFFWIFTQYYFTKQWLQLKTYANNKGIKIIGDLPIYVAGDSADCFANPEFFNLDEDLAPKTVAGVPPDAFSDDGQLWGNPIYDWDTLEDHGYSWWIRRFKHSFKLFDTLRVDHFRGFDAYWEVKYGENTAVKGQWVKGPGIKFFNKIKEELGELDIIAEDLGVNSEGLTKLIEETGFPNMKILQFAFDTEDSAFLPHNYDKNCVAYIGTHDNHPLMAWFDKASQDEIDYAIEYFKLDEEEGLNWGMIRGLWGSPAYLAIAQIQDLLGLGEVSRMNEPSTLGNNWTWRVSAALLTDELENKIADLTKLYGREK